MTTPREEQPPTPAPVPSVTTAPPRSRWSVSRVPSHLGPARTSTVLLAVLFVGFFALWLYVRPQSAQIGTAGSTSGGAGTGSSQVEQTTTPSTPTPTPTPTRTTAPTRTTTPSRASTSSSTRSRTSEPTASTTSGETGGTSTTAGSSIPVPPVPSTGSSAPTS